MPKITYFLSNIFNYDLMICSDAGPDYAKAFRWNTQLISSLKYSETDIAIIDNRITPIEFEILNESINIKPAIFLLKVVDTYIESRDQPYIQFLLSLKPKDNLYFLSPYPAEEIGKELAEKHGKEHFICIPYPYVKHKEKKISLDRRKKRVLVSGNLAPEGYPFRSNFHNQTYHKIWSFFQVSYLPHCGYPDIGLRLNHQFIGNSYINFLSNYYFMLLCPGRLSFEYLKYSECAYGGCIPIGKKPSSFKDLPNEYFFDIDEDNIRASLKKLFSLDKNYLENIAIGYRSWMQSNRSPEHLTSLLLSKIKVYI